jgi:RNA polymerase sigma factor (sigma-70 family)
MDSNTHFDELTAQESLAGLEPGRQHDRWPTELSDALPDPPSLLEIPSVDRETLYREFDPLVRRLIRQYGTTTEMRQDLAGEIYFRFCVLLEDYNPDRGVPLRPYLGLHLWTSIYSYARRGWWRQSREVDCDSVKELLCHDPTTEWIERIAMEDVFAELSQAVAKLPPRQRMVVIWRYREDRTFEEIASQLQVKMSTARSLLRHGLKNLRRQLESSVAEY